MDRHHAASMVIAVARARGSAIWLYTLEKMQNRPIDENVLRLLVCPLCHAALTSPDQEMILCTGCGRRYPIRDGLPVLLSDAARH
jgi:uncharacterized protein YbaR (Trm112 family)